VEEDMKNKIFLSLFVLISIMFAGNNYSILETGTKKQKLDLLKTIREKKDKKAGKSVLDLLESTSDNDILINSIITIGKIQYTKASKKLIEIYKSSSKSEVRFAVVLGLIDLKDIFTLDDLKKAYKTETDKHIKLALTIILEELNIIKKKKKK